jgi:hypothetical protein
VEAKSLQAAPTRELQERRAYGQREQKPKDAAPDHGVPEPNYGRGVLGTSRLLHRPGSMALLAGVVLVIVQLAWLVFLVFALVWLLGSLL